MFFYKINMCMTNYLDLVTYPEKYKRFAMGLSSGADSTMLLYLMCLKYPAPDYKLYVVTQGSCIEDWYGPITTRATAIVNLIKQKIPNHPIVDHILYDDTRFTIANMAKDLRDDNLIDLYISGTTAHPHDVNASATGDDGVVATLFLVRVIRIRYSAPVPTAHVRMSASSQAITPVFLNPLVPSVGPNDPHVPTPVEYS